MNHFIVLNLIPNSESSIYLTNNVQIDILLQILVRALIPIFTIVVIKNKLKNKIRKIRIQKKKTLKSLISE